MTTLSIETLDSPTALVSHYPNEHRLQDCFIELDLWSGRMSARSNPEIGNAVPMDVWHGLVRRYALSGPILSDDANTLMADIANHAQSILDHAEVEWDGSNNVVRTHKRDPDKYDSLHDEGECDCPVAVAERAIESVIDEVDYEASGIDWFSAEDWYTDIEDLTPEEFSLLYVPQVQALVLDGKDEGDAISTVSNQMEQEIEDNFHHNCLHVAWVVVGGIEEYLAQAVAEAKVIEDEA